MLSIKRDGTRVVIWAKASPLGDDHGINMTYETQSEWLAEFIVQKLKADLGKLVSEIREVSYRRGWRDAKSKKRPKDDFFPTCLDVREWEREAAGQKASV